MSQLSDKEKATLARFDSLPDSAAAPSKFAP